MKKSETAKAKSAFERDDTDFAASGAVVVRSAADARTAFGYIARRLKGCLLAFARKDGYKATVREIAGGRIGDESLALQETLDRDDLILPVDVETVFVRDGRALVGYFFGGLSPSDTRQELAEVKRAIGRA